VGGPSAGYGSHNQQQLQLGGPTAQQYGQLGQGQYNDTSAPGGQYNNNNSSSSNIQQVAPYGDFNQQQQQQGPGDAGPPPPNCDCGGPAATRTSNSARNPGRQFFSCSKPMGDEGRCNFFKWVDALAAAGGGGSQAGGWGGAAEAGEAARYAAAQHHLLCLVGHCAGSWRGR
jgi:DNA topoisomerase-3